MRIFHLQSVITNQKKNSSGYYQLSFLAPGIAKFAQPGQFVHIFCWGGAHLRRPFSIAGVKKEQIEIIYKVVGKGTELLSQKKKGKLLDVIGPLGNGFSLSPNAYHLSPILVAGGTGVASLLFLAQHLSTYKLINLPARRSRLASAKRVALAGGSTVVLIGAKTKKELLGINDFKKLGCAVKISTEDGSLGSKGLVTDLFRRHLSTYPLTRLPTAVYGCGPYPMLKEVAKIAEKNKIPCQVSLETIIACGLGACRGCVVKTRMTADRKKSQIAADKFEYKTVCKDGPVFAAKEIVWE